MHSTMQKVAHSWLLELEQSKHHLCSSTVRNCKEIELTPRVPAQHRCLSTRNVLTFLNTTTIAYQNHAAPEYFLPVCNSSCVHKRQDTPSTVQVQELDQVYWFKPGHPTKGKARAINRCDWAHIRIWHAPVTSQTGRTCCLSPTVLFWGMWRGSCRCRRR